MRFAQAAGLALVGLAAHPMRSALAVLGIVVGVMAVVTMVSIGSGAREVVAEQIRSLGANLVIINAGNITRAGIQLAAGSAQSLIEDDARAIEAEVDGVAAAASVIRGAVQVVSQDRNWYAPTHAVTPNFFVARQWTVETGRLFESEGGSSEIPAVLGKTVAKRLFGDADPAGELIRLRNVPAKVAGVLTERGQSAFGFDEDNIVFVPLEGNGSRVIGRNLIRPGAVTAIYVRFDRAEAIAPGIQQINALLRERHQLPPQTVNDFGVANVNEIAATAAASDGTLTLFLTALAGVSLLVGGIGIMNIMLVSVTERTREIGLRLAIGARPRDILRQFLLEAVALSVMGGIVGVILGFLMSHVVAASFSWPTIVTLNAMIVAIFVSCLTGAISGIYPARRAARLEPAEALRRE